MAPRRQCELGKACPYQHEMQHQQEFLHDLAGPPPKEKPFAGVGRLVGRGGGRTGGSKQGGAKDSKLLREIPQLVRNAPVVKKKPVVVNNREKKKTAQSPLVIDDDDDDEVEIVEKPLPTKKKTKKPTQPTKDSDSDSDSEVEIVEPPPKKKKRVASPEVQIVKVRPPPKVPDEIARNLTKAPSSVTRLPSSAARLRTEQDAEYEASLAADRAKARRKEEEEEEKRVAAEIDAAIEASKASKEEEDTRRKDRIKKRLEQSGEGLKVRLRFPDGTTKSHDFRPSAPLSDLFAFVEVHGPEGLSSNVDIVDVATRQRLLRGGGGGEEGGNIDHDDGGAAGEGSPSFADRGFSSGSVSFLVIDQDA